MPTPFTHLAAAQKLRVDPLLPNTIRALIEAELPAFLLGNVAADARISGNVTRESTHFFSYDRPIERSPWRVMLDEHPLLQSPLDDGQKAFLAGYVAHLAMDELWSLEMVRPHFGMAHWGNRQQRFIMLHLILIHMDERDYGVLESWQRDCLLAAQPQAWTTFLTDATLVDWRDFIGRQLAPGKSETLEVLGERINIAPALLRAMLDDSAQMHLDLWQHVPQSLLYDVETRMYDHAREAMIQYCALR
jgi:hypothetical protein